MRSRLAETDVYYGWVVVAACFLGSLVVFGLSYSFGVFFEAMLAEFGRSRGDTSLVFSVHTFTLYVGAVLIGGLIDAYGVRRLMVAGTAAFAAGLAWTSHADSLFELVLAYGVVTSVGLSVVYVISYATVPRWFGRRRGFAGGIASSGLGVGMLVMAPAAAALVASVGWRRAYLAFLVGTVALLAVATALLADEPADVGADTAVEFGERAPPTAGDDRLAAVAAAAGDRSFQLVFLGWICIYATLYVILVNLVVYATDLGLAAGVGARAIGLIGAASFLARLGVGFASDHLGRVRVFAVCSAVMGLATVAFPLARTTLALYAVALAYGLAYGGNGALLGPLTADLFGTADINAVFGLMSASFAISGLAAPYLAGLTYDVLATYTPAFLASGGLAVFGAALIAIAGRREGAI